jgi:hypothetical protein
MPNFRVEIGEDTNGHVSFMEFAQFRAREAVGTNVEITVFITSCYSGSWVVYPQFNATVATAAGSSRDQLDDTVEAFSLAQL